MIRIIFLLFFIIKLSCQNINVNNDFDYNLIRTAILKNDIKTKFSLNIKPIDYSMFKEINLDRFKTILENNSGTISIKTLGIDYFTEYNHHHPYNRNNGTMIPNRGFQHILSPGIFLKIGPLSIKLKPEHHYSDNKDFDKFWDGHYPEIWQKRYKLWNKIDMPERFGNNRHNDFFIGQSNIKLSFKQLSVGISKENLWWGPSIRNSIMMSNHAPGFKHISFNSNYPVSTKIGDIEWQLVTGVLEQSNYKPTNSNYIYAGTKLYFPSRNQLGNRNDTRFFQGYIISYSPKFIDNFSIGFIRWVTMYSALLEGKYNWLQGKPSYFAVFQNLFRKNDKFVDYEAQTNQAAGIFFKWIWKDSKAEIYAEFHYNDSKNNFRDLLLDSDHSRAATIGIQKIFDINENEFLFNWEWTQMEQTAGRLLRNAGSWYEHRYVTPGYTNRGEVLGSSIGPGSNSHYISINRIKNSEKIGIGIEVVDNDNDFYHFAFQTAKDYRRYWKDFNLHINFNKSYNKFSLSSNLVYIRSLNYQWELDDFQQPYYHAGRDVDNFHLSLKFTYFGNW